MADLTFAPGPPGAIINDPSGGTPDGGTGSTIRRVRRAWSELSGRRRRISIGGAALAVAAGTASVTAAEAPITTGIAIAMVGVLGGAAAIVDVHERRLPNRLSGLSLLIVAAAALLDDPWTGVDALISMSMAAVPLWVVRYGRGLAFGDVKFAAVLGAATGLVHPYAGVVVVWVAALSAGVFALRTGRRRLAFGPWLWAGYLTGGVVVVVVQALLSIGGRTWPARP
ncbi:MAG: prepilin peptidase [Acidimicrobiales bacterium]|nr:prepilin peptidase [Acidimicrobiales bacterium]MCB9392548.1 prepilin peptidase [Acidimicrobiaceae bacterium]